MQPPAEISDALGDARTLTASQRHSDGVDRVGRHDEGSWVVRSVSSIRRTLAMSAERAGHRSSIGVEAGSEGAMGTAAGRRADGDLTRRTRIEAAHGDNRLQRVELARRLRERGSQAHKPQSRAEGRRGVASVNTRKLNLAAWPETTRMRQRRDRRQANEDSRRHSLNTAESTCDQPNAGGGRRRRGVTRQADR